MYGQGYDGASNMSGRFKGTQKIVRETCPKALYVHCAAHSLNLAVSTSCDIQAIRNSLGLVEKMYCFLNTPKRKNVLLSVINESDLDTRSIYNHFLTYKNYLIIFYLIIYNLRLFYILFKTIYLA